MSRPETSDTEIVDAVWQASQPENVAMRMADALYDNAEAYLRGQREGFCAYFGLAQEIHRRASINFFESLLKSEYGELTPHSDDERMVWEHGSKEHIYYTKREIVARSGARLIIAASKAEVIPGLEHEFMPSDLHFYGESVESVSTDLITD